MSFVPFLFTDVSFRVLKFESNFIIENHHLIKIVVVSAEWLEMRFTDHTLMNKAILKLSGQQAEKSWRK